MPRFAQDQQDQRTPQIDGDRFFLGLNMQMDPGLLPEGFISKGENCRIEDGTVGARRNHIGLTWTNLPGDSNANPTSQGATYEAKLFSQPGGTEYVVLATAAASHSCKQGNHAVASAYPSGVTLAANVRMIQAFDKMYMLRGEETGSEPIVWDGIPGHAWKLVDQTEPGGGQLAFPNSKNGTYFQGRLCLIRDRDSFIVSDAFSDTAFNIANEYFVNRGADDTLVHLHPYGTQRLLAFKNQSIWLISNFFGDLSAIRGDVITTEVGCVAADTVVTVGQDVLFLSDKGVYSIRQAFDEKLEAGTEPISEPIQPLIDRIIWDQVEWATATFHNNRYYLSVPMFGEQTLSSENVVTLVYNFTNKAWESMDTNLFTESVNEPFFNPRKLVRADLLGHKELILADYDGYLSAYAWGIGPDGEDQRDAAGNSTFMLSTVETRGYGGRDPQHSKALYATVSTSHWWPQYAVLARSEGVNENQVLDGDTTAGNLDKHFATSTFSNTAYRTFGTAAFDVTNTSLDHRNAYREDYGIALDDDATGVFLMNGGADTGVDFDLHQETQLSYRMKRFGRYVQLRLFSRGGVFDIKGVKMESSRARRGALERV